MFIILKMMKEMYIIHDQKKHVKEKLNMMSQQENGNETGDKLNMVLESQHMSSKSNSWIFQSHFILAFIEIWLMS